MIRVRQIKISVDNNTNDNILLMVSKKLNIKVSDIVDFKINKRSIDARKKPNIYFIYEIDIELVSYENIKITSNDILFIEDEKYSFNIDGLLEYNQISIIGAGPAGLFCAYLLAKNGFKPVIYERGKNIEDRLIDVENFLKTGELNVNSNIQFGEGGAGTFSDGKLNTLIKDKLFRAKFVLETLVEFGAPSEILFDSKPHIGTDLLRDVIIKMRNQILKMGGIINYNSFLTNINIQNSKIISITVNNSIVINTDILVLAIGHSARDTFKMLYNNSILLESKPFAVGVRIMHDQKFINKSQIGVSSHDILGEQSYKLTYNTILNKGVYTFCMCPGGFVINSSSLTNRLVINGMSNHKRDSGIANSAIIVTVNKDDFGDHVLSGMDFQEKLEKTAYDLCNGKIPIQLYKDFKSGVVSTKLGSISPKISGEYAFSNIRNIFSDNINDALIEGIENFGKKINGFNSDDALIAGVESRTSSPVKIVRNDFFESSILGIYPCGEGSGYAGGITSAAIDGMKIAEAIAGKYSNKKTEDTL